MEKKHIKEISLKMTEIRKTKRKVMTNYYLTYNGADVLFDTFVTEETIVFCIQENNIYRVFYYSVDEKDLIENLKKLPKNSILDIVAQEGSLDVQWLEGAGFYLYSTYARFGQPLLDYENQKELMSKNRIDAFYNEEYGECATVDDVQELQRLISKGFDEKTDHLFSDEELEDLINNKNILVQRESGEIFCIFIYKIEGKKFYYNLSYNEGTADVLYSIEKKSLLNAIKEYGVSYAYSWMALTNKKALKRSAVPADHMRNYIFEKKELDL